MNTSKHAAMRIKFAQEVNRILEESHKQIEIDSEGIHIILNVKHTTTMFGSLEEINIMHLFWPKFFGEKLSYLSRLIINGEIYYLSESKNFSVLNNFCKLFYHNHKIIQQQLKAIMDNIIANNGQLKINGKFHHQLVPNYAIR